MVPLFEDEDPSGGFLERKQEHQMVHLHTAHLDETFSKGSLKLLIFLIGILVSAR